MQLKLDDITGDLAFENEKLVMIEGNQEIQQLLVSRLRTFLGEYFLNTDVGVPYFQVIFEKGVNPTVIYNIFVEKITQTDGILELSELDIDVDMATRSATVEIEAMSEEGFISFTLPLGVV